jgi:hypothetical protein
MINIAQLMLELEFLLLSFSLCQSWCTELRSRERIIEAITKAKILIIHFSSARNGRTGLVFNESFPICEFHQVLRVEQK